MIQGILFDPPKEFEETQKLFDIKDILLNLQKSLELRLPVQCGGEKDRDKEGIKELERRRYVNEIGILEGLSIYVSLHIEEAEKVIHH